MRLRIEVDGKRPVLHLREAGEQVERSRRLADAALLVEYGNDGHLRTRVAMQQSPRRSSARRAEISGMHVIFACIAQDVRHALRCRAAGCRRAAQNAIIRA